jgi:hypothetical protein
MLVSRRSYKIGAVNRNPNLVQSPLFSSRSSRVRRKANLTVRRVKQAFPSLWIAVLEWPLNAPRAIRFLAAIFIGLLLLTQAPLSATAIGPEEHPSPTLDLVAVLDLNSSGATDVEASVATDTLGEALFSTGRYRVITREQLNERYKPAVGKSGEAVPGIPANCTTTGCAVEVGKAVGVAKIVSGRLTQLDATHWVLSAALIDVQSGQAVQRGSVDYEGDFFGLLRTAPTQLARTLVAPPPVAQVQQIPPDLLTQPLPTAPVGAVTGSVRDRENAVYPCLKANSDRYNYGLYAAGLIVWPSTFTTTSLEVHGRHTCAYGSGLTYDEFDDVGYVFSYGTTILRNIASGGGDALASYYVQLGCPAAVRPTANRALQEHLDELSQDETKPGDFIFDSKRILRAALQNQPACTHIGPEADG